MTPAPHEINAEYFTREVAELERNVTWVITPLWQRMSLDYLEGKTTSLCVVSLSELLDHASENVTAPRHIRPSVATVPLILTELDTPVGTRTYLIDGNHRLQWLARHGLSSAACFLVPDELRRRAQLTEDEQAAFEGGDHSVLNRVMGRCLPEAEQLAARLQQLGLDRAPVPRPLIGQMVWPQPPGTPLRALHSTPPSPTSLACAYTFELCEHGHV